MTSCILFPAFVGEYSGGEETFLSGFKNNFPERLQIASEILGTDLTGFDFQENNFLADELKSQYISYLFSCSVADILRQEKVKPAFVTGYSMGIYAALYYCGSVGFRDGLNLVRTAWEVISGETSGGNFGMGMIIGLDELDVNRLLGNSGNVEICNRNNKLTYIISGSRNKIESVLDSAKEEGAMKVSLLPVSKPYHSHYLLNTGPAFTSLIRGIEFKHPENAYISSLDQKALQTADQVRSEVIRNLCSRMDWQGTMEYLIGRGTEYFFECGAGDGMTRNLRFVEGDFKAFQLSRLGKFLETQKY